MTPSYLAETYHTIAVEGADGTGKTTLVNDLPGFKVIHSGRTPDGTDINARYRRILATPGRLALDRCFVSELVYGPLYHGQSRISWDEAIELADAVSRRRGVFVHLTGQAETIHQRLLERDRVAPKLTTIDELLAAYDNVFAVLANHTVVIRIDTTR